MDLGLDEYDEYTLIERSCFTLPTEETRFLRWITRFPDLTDASIIVLWRAAPSIIEWEFIDAITSVEFPCRLRYKVSPEGTWSRLVVRERITVLEGYPHFESE